MHTPHASSQSIQDLDSSGLGFDLEDVVRTANDKVSGTFNVLVTEETSYYVGLYWQHAAGYHLFFNGASQLCPICLLLSFAGHIKLSYYAISYFPRGSAGVKFFTSALTSSILRCFGR
ncbi:hypothetical protein L6452_00597 [Arctium lappa]|uniref:Uncharacterized protein n=1 Tax=Arctium lappa TaxID=4217 RepID=A0ACB9FEK9_ARCLA|nr:hypothetical protein L6452_00597 [Arctium lappa]